MSQRLVRAKNKIRDAAIPFRVPEPPEWDERVSFVLDAIYSAYTTGWDSLNEAGSTHQALAGEAISLGRTLVQLMPVEPEARGLLALMLHCEARRAARFTERRRICPARPTGHGALVATDDGRSRGTPSSCAAALKHMGRYQLEAAIQSIHASRAKSGRIDWPEIALLYEGLVRNRARHRLARRTRGRAGASRAIRRRICRAGRNSSDRVSTTSPIGPRAGICCNC